MENASANDKARAESSPWLNRGLAFLVLCVVFFRAAETYADPDIWGHIRFGLDMLETGKLVPLHDPYSYLTEGHDWIDNEWLADLLVGFLFQTFGAPALILMKALIAVAVTGLLYAILCRAGFNSLWGGFLLLPGAFLILAGFTGLLMMIFTYLCFAILMALLIAAESDRRWMWAMPPLFVLWINLHPGVLAGIGCAGAWIITHLILLARKEGPQAALIQAPGRDYWLLGVAILLSTLVNPYGINLPLLLVRDGFANRSEISQFVPIRVAGLEGLTYVLLLGLSVAGWIFTTQPRSIPLLVVFACTALTPLIAVRHTPLFAIAALALAGPHLADLWKRWQTTREASSPPKPWMAAVPFVGGFALIALATPHLRDMKTEPAVNTVYPQSAVALLKDSGVRGRLVVFFDWGEYVLWHVGPGVQVSLDPRRHSAYPDAVYKMNFQFQNGVGPWDDLLSEGPADMVLLSKRFPAFNLMRTKADWTLVYEDDLAALFVRADSPLRKALVDTKVRTELGTTFP